MMNSHDQGDTSTRVVADKVRPLEAKVIHQTENHAGLSQERAVEEIASVGISVAEEIGRNDPALAREQRNHLVVEKRPGGNAVQKNDRLALANIGLSHAERLIGQAVEFGRFLSLPKGLMR